MKKQLLILGLVGFVTASMSRAATLDWIGLSGGDYNSAANWSPVQTPTGSDLVLIGDGANLHDNLVYINGTALANELGVGWNGTNNVVELQTGSLQTGKLGLKNGAATFRQLAGTATITSSAVYVGEGGFWGGANASATSQLLLDGGSFLTKGNAVQIGWGRNGYSRLQTGATLDTSTSGTQSGGGGVLQVGSGNGGTGTWDVQGGTAYIGGDVRVGDGLAGTVNQSGGTVTVNGTLYAGWTATSAYNLSGGTLNATTLTRFSSSGPGDFNFTGGTLSANTVGSNLVLTNSGGVLAPGLNNTVGQTTVNGNYTVNSLSATLQIQMSGTTQTSGYDFLDVNGTATLGGDLVVSLLSFTPNFTDVFEVGEADSAISSFFANAPVNGGTYNLGPGTFRVRYNVSGFGTSGNVILDQFELAAVPEPSTILLLVVGGAVAWRKRRSLL